jgi:hypothetical protein
MDENALDEDALMALAERLETLPLEHADWVVPLFLECQRARAAEARLLANGGNAGSEADITQVVLDTADWLRTLWEVGYMGGEAFPAPPRSAFPSVSVEDILKSALFARIRQGKRPLPFPPPTRDGVPWHEVVESSETFAVRARLGDDGGVSIEGCAEWRTVETIAANREVLVQHRGKGPLYRLVLGDDGAASLQKQPAAIRRRILFQSRAGIDAYLLEWPKDDSGDIIRVPLRAAGWERAENEAHRWVALRHPHLYGQIHFERSEA